MLGLSLPFAFAVAVGAGYLLARRALAPVSAMTARAREITADHLEERLPVENPFDEFGQLAVVINDALARLERAFETLRRFTADASHELRTPLTAIRSVGEVGLRERRSEAEYREMVGVDSRGDRAADDDGGQPAAALAGRRGTGGSPAGGAGPRRPGARGGGGPRRARRGEAPAGSRRSPSRR